MDARTDIYGLGAILFTILTGEPPHRGKRHGGSAQDTADLLRRISEQPTPDARSIDRAVPAALSAICARAMARKRAERYPQALALAEDVQRWLADEPVSVYRETRRERLARWVRRHRTWAAAAAVALTLISIVSLVAAGFVNRARQDTQRALESEQQARAQTQQALDAEQKALAAERAAKAEAMRRFLEARETVDKSLTGVSNVLRYYPGVEPLRIELLKKAAEDYERFAREQSDDPQLQAESGRALIRLGDVRQLLGETELARRAYAAAQAAFDKLAQGQPASREFELELATVHGRLAVLATATAAHDEAARSFDAAARLLDKLGRGSGGEARVRHLRAEVLVNQATLLAQTGRRTGAQKLLDEAEADLADLAGVAGDRRALEGLARTRSESGQLLGGLGRTAEGVAKLKQALATYQRLASIDPNHPPYLEGLCEARVALGNALAALGRDREILQAYEAARADYRDLLKVRPGVPFYRESLALVDTNLALMLHRLERNPTAKQHAMDGLSECVELVNAHPQVVRYHAQHATATLTLGLILRELDETMLAETALDDAVRRCVELTDQVRDVPEHRRRLASSVMARGRLFASTGRGAAAIAEFRRALADLDKAAKAGLDDPATADARAWCHQYLADALLAAGNAMEAATHYAQCRTLQERLTADVDDSGARRPADPEQLMNFAIFLANCASPQFRDPAGADRLARAATARVADNGRYQTALGLAAYRAGHIDDAITAARHAIELRDGGCSSDWFTLAMAQEKKGEKQEARKSFDRGIEIMKANCPGSVEAGRLRREAAGLLAVPDAPQ
jgi:serine/threonine-protein kinase